MYKYNLKDILHFTRDCYKFIGVDDVLIYKLLSYGYKHECNKPNDDIHDRIEDHHVTLVFRLNNSITEV